MLAATTVVAATVVGDSVTAVVVSLIAANKENDYKDNNPCAVITAVE